MKNEKIKIKPLATQIKYLIEIEIKTWRDNTYGNTYCSARCTVNRDYTNTIVYPYHYNQPGQCERDVLRSVIEKYPILGKYIEPGYVAQSLYYGALVSTIVTKTTKTECKNFGHARG